MMKRFKLAIACSMMFCAATGCSLIPRSSSTATHVGERPANSTAFGVTTSSNGGVSGNSTQPNAPDSVQRHTPEAVATLAAAGKTLGGTHRLSGVGIPVLTYHDVGGMPNDEFSLQPSQFAEQMAYLSTHGYHVITLNELYQKLYENPLISLPAKPVVITFDDGYESNYTVAFPILKRYHFPATIFMITGVIGHGGPMFMTEHQLAEMQASGLVDIESHTVHHPHLAALKQTDIVAELTQSKATLEEDLKKSIPFFCYPYSSYNGLVIKDVHAAGYELAVTENPGLATSMENRYALNRMPIHASMTMQDFATALTGQVLNHNPPHHHVHKNASTTGSDTHA